METPPLHSDPLYVKVYTVLKGWILSGELPPGSRIRETTLAAQLHVSRTPVRDALRRLEQDRLITPLPGQAYEVYQPTLRDLEDLYHARALLEGGAARLAAARPPEEVAELTRRMSDVAAQIERAYDQEPISRAVHLDMQFHELLVAGSNNPVLVELHNHLSTRLRHARTLSGDIAARRQSVLDQHAAIIDALQRRQGDAAEEATRLHILFILASVKKGFETKEWIP